MDTDWLPEKRYRRSQSDTDRSVDRVSNLRMTFQPLTEISMYRKTLALSLSAAVLGIAACASPAELVGTAGGAAVGSAVSGGSTMATVAGGVVGYAAGKTYDAKHK